MVALRLLGLIVWHIDLYALFWPPLTFFLRAENIIVFLSFASNQHSF